MMGRARRAEGKAARSVRRKACGGFRSLLLAEFIAILVVAPGCFAQAQQTAPGAPSVQSSSAGPASPAAQTEPGKPPKKKKTPKPDALDDYLKVARLESRAEAPTTGSLWRPNGFMADLASDDKARYVGDEVTIQLAESTATAQQGSVQTARTLNASSGVTELFGQSNSILSNLFSPASSQALNGKGQTALTTSFNTTLAANIVEVLPSGLYVIEARRQVRVTDQNETVTLRGIIRRSDLSPGNVVLSTAISQMEVNLVGKGVITEGTHPTNAVIRIMLRVLGF
jgi:flagellar L-ring protein FlgH